MIARTTLWTAALAALLGCGSGSGSGDELAVTTGTGAGGASVANGSGAGGAAEADGAAGVAADLPSELACGASYAATVEMRNTGTETWTQEAGYKLGAVGDEDPLHGAAQGEDTRVWLGESDVVAPGESHVFAFTLTAPFEEGSYTTDWQMVHERVGWFGAIAASEVAVSCAIQKRTGLVQLDGSSLSDDQGKFNALGASLFWAAWAYKFDKPKLEANLAYLSQHGFDYIRALGVVGDYQNADFWDGREIDWHWSDYADVIAGVTDLAYDSYGLRVEWTLIGDGQVTIPDSSDRYALADTFLAMSAGREEKIIHFEIANEYWQNGFAGSEGLEELRDLSSYMRDATDILVAASAPAGHECADLEAVYAGGVADLATNHFDRDISKTEGSWRPVRQPWEHDYCIDVPVGSNNEPIGPGASVSSENDPLKLVAAAINSYVANLPLYVFHSKAGVRGDENIWEMAGADAFLPMKQAAIVPGDLASWSRKNAHWSDSPFRFYAGEGGQLYGDQMWPDLGAPESGAVRGYGDVNGSEFFVFPIGILGSVLIEARQSMTFDVIDPLTGMLVATHDLAAGEQVTLTGSEALVLHGNYQ